jgi:pimeloyl-ACP methyl ester carboxylesterase
MTTTPYPPAAVPLPAVETNAPHVRRSRGRIGLIVGTSVGAGIVTALGLTLGVFDGASEHVITGVALLSFAFGWLLLATLTGRFTEQPQRWAFVPAAVTAGTGAALLMFAPGDSTIAALGWIWPAALLALAAWTAVKARDHLRSWSRRAIIYPVTVVMALAAIGGGIETAVAAAPAMPAQGHLVDVGGHRLYLECAGTGTPTVVLANGFSEHTPSWAWITPTISQTTQVCVYDRAGQGWSDPSSSPQDGNQVADDLHTLLDNAGIPGPYLLAGHSTGGVYSLIFAARYPADVAGMVLLDSATPEQFTALPDYSGAYALSRRITALFPPLARLGMARLFLGNGFTDLPPTARDQEQAFASTAHELNGQRDEWSQLPSAFEQAKALHDLGTKPLIVVTAGLEQQPGWFGAQDKLAALSGNTAHRTIADATHAALLDNPTFAAFANAAILDVLTAARTGAALRP